MDLNLDRYVDRAIYFSAFEFTTVSAFRSILRPGDIAIDVGANIGFFALLAARMVGSTGRVVAFEPNATVRTRLNHGVRRNNAIRTVEVVPLGLNHAATEEQLFVPSGEAADPGLASMRPVKDRDCHVDTIATVTLDEWIARHPVAPRLIKLDIEGAELPALRGAQRTLTTFRPHVICEYNDTTASAFGYDPFDIVSFLVDSIGHYRVKLLMSRRIVDVPNITRDAVCRPRVENWWFIPVPQ